MSDRKKYLLVSKDQAEMLFGAVVTLAKGNLSALPGCLVTLLMRLRDDTGGDFEEIATLLKKQEICAACSIEGQSSSCNSLDANKLGRRIARLIARAQIAR